MKHPSDSNNPLGQATEYKSEYDPGLLFAIRRAQTREGLSLSEHQSLPFVGYDRWTAYELSWLDNCGKPRVAMAEFIVDCQTPCIIESKSLKLYLNSFNQTRFDSKQVVVDTLQRDLAKAFQGNVSVQLFGVVDQVLPVETLPGKCVDAIDCTIEYYHPRPQLLATEPQQLVEHQVIYSHLLKTNCPVTAQPDWASVFVEYSGNEILPESFLAYVVSFREHQDFHENCVEQFFCDIKNYCHPEKLAVYARYTRRGGLDINPYRSDFAPEQSLLANRLLRTVRQ